eukprot:1183691-Prorocentrum_minimum.AAC.1
MIVSFGLDAERVRRRGCKDDRLAEGPRLVVLARARGPKPGLAELIEEVVMRCSIVHIDPHNS